MVEKTSRKSPWLPLYPFESNWIHLPSGPRMHYLDEGEGEPILALHGNPTWSFYYRELVKAMRTEYRVVVPDHIGCGFSEKPQDYNYRLTQHIDNLEALVDRLDLEPFNLVMHDWGGAIGMGLAVRKPERVKRILLLNTAAFRMPIMPRILLLARCPILAPLLIRGFNAFVLGALLTSTKRTMPPVVWSGYKAPYDSWANRVAILRFVQDIPMTPRHPSYQTLTEIEQGLPLLADKPISVAWGALDRVFDDRFLERWKEIFPEADFVRFGDVGHYSMEDASERVLMRLRDLLARPS
ncbi:MAG: alpha/beta fold hydrolase [Candidatus Xenobium sp.]